MNYSKRTQRYIARKIGIHPRYLNAVLHRQRRPSPPLAERIAIEYGDGNQEIINQLIMYLLQLTDNLPDCVNF